MDSELVRLREERDALLGNPEACHQGALAAFSAIRHAATVSEERDALSTALAETTERMVALEAERDALAAALDECVHAIHDWTPEGGLDLTDEWLDSAAEKSAAILAARDARMISLGAEEVPCRFTKYQKGKDCISVYGESDGFYCERCAVVAAKLKEAQR